MSTIGKARRPPVLLHLSVLCILVSGCSQLIESNKLGPVQRLVEPEFGGRYLLYRPSSYDREQSWPLIVVCHSSFPDSPDRLIGDWTKLAERYGFVLVAPHLKRAGRSLRGNAERKLTTLEENERHILATVRHVRAGHSISDDRVMIHGWHRGAGPALHTGLRHPDLFRAVSLTQPRLDADSLPGIWTEVDHDQPVYVNHNISDLITGKHGRNCVDWLRSIGANLKVDTLGKARRSDGDRPVEFFQRVIRKEPWLHIRAFAESTDRPLEIRFKLQSSAAPTRYRWQFGDGDDSPVAEPVHLYKAPGSYRVTVTVQGTQGAELTRRAELTVPDVRLRPATADADNPR